MAGDQGGNDHQPVEQAALEPPGEPGQDEGKDAMDEREDPVMQREEAGELPFTALNRHQLGDGRREAVVPALGAAGGEDDLGIRVVGEDRPPVAGGRPVAGGGVAREGGVPVRTAFGGGDPGRDLVVEIAQDLVHVVAGAEPELVEREGQRGRPGAAEPGADDVQRHGFRCP